MKTISLTQGKVAIIDDIDYLTLNHWKWSARKQRGIWYAMRQIPYNHKQYTLLMHRDILNATYGLQVDHRNHDGLDNRRQNLRLCTNRQNAQNARPQNRNKSSKFKGVYWQYNSTDKHWTAAISFNGIRLYLGIFRDQEEAARAYDVKAKERFGEFAYLNFPIDSEKTRNEVE